MECEKNILLQATSDTEHLIADSFILEGQLTDLYLYPHQLKIIQKDKNRIIPIRFGLNFSIIEGANGKTAGLEFCFGDSQIRFERDFWPRARQWEIVLLKYVTRKEFHQFFRPMKKIGRGNFATVYLAEDIYANRRVAIKAFMKEVTFKGEGRSAIENEIKLMRKVNSPNLVSLYGVYETKNSIYLSMQYVQGMTLEAFLKKNRNPSMEQRRSIMKGLLSGLRQLYKQRIVHRDIKPENIIVSADCQTVKIVDFGLATYIDEESYIFIRCGTPGYVAPEILKIRDLHNVRLGLASDMFSLGAIYYQLIYGKALFPGQDQNEVLMLNRQCRIKITPKEGLGYGEIELLCNMLQYDPNCRIGPEEALKTTFLQDKKQIFLRTLQPIEPQTANEWIFDQE